MQSVQAQEDLATVYMAHRRQPLKTALEKDSLDVSVVTALILLPPPSRS